MLDITNTPTHKNQIAMHSLRGKFQGVQIEDGQVPKVDIKGHRSFHVRGFTFFEYCEIILQYLYMDGLQFCLGSGQGGRYVEGHVSWQERTKNAKINDR